MSTLAALFWPVPAADSALQVNAIFWTLLVLCGAITGAICVAVTYFCIRYRAGSKAPREERTGNTTAIEIGWTSATCAVFVGIFIWAGAIYFRLYHPPEDAVEVQVVAKQWMWKIQHLNGRREINELHLLVNEPVRLTMTSQDVIHDFYVPAFRTKQDVLPGRYTTEWFTPRRPGRYHIFCAEYCGMDHSRMGGWVEVMEPAAYARWLAQGESSESVVAAGARLFTERGCAGCHLGKGPVRAPALGGLYGHPVALSDGTTMIADDQYLHDSILLPNKQITAGYEAKMPTYQGQLHEEEVMALIAYLKALPADPLP